MLRRFLPVGQGAFYCEQFLNHNKNSFRGNNRINVVYDCGSLSENTTILYPNIERCFKDGEKIHAFFISHFDKDHVSGLEFLLRHYQIEHIFFPLLTKEDKALLRLQHLVNNSFIDKDSFWLRFALNPNEALKQLNLDYAPVLHPVRSENRGDEDAEFQDMPNGFRTNNNVDLVRSGENVFECVKSSVEPSHSFCKSDWLYIPYHFREKTKRDILKAILKENLGSSEPEKLLNLLKCGALNIADLKEVYSKIPGEVNTNSLTLFSGTKSDCHASILLPCECLHMGCRRHMRCPCIKSGTLYLGDYDASGNQKWKHLQRAYQEYDSYIGCLQVPHHGSKHNFNLELAKIKTCCLYFISAGLDNQYNHPDGDVVKQIMLSGKYVRVITEDPSSEIIMEVGY